MNKEILTPEQIEKIKHFHVEAIMAAVNKIFTHNDLVAIADTITDVSYLVDESYDEPCKEQIGIYVTLISLLADLAILYQRHIDYTKDLIHFEEQSRLSGNS